MNKKGFKLDFKKHILLNLPYFAMFYVVNKLSAATQAAKGSSLSDKLFAAVLDFNAAFQNPLPSFNPIDLLIGAAAAGLFLLIITEKRKNAKKFRHGIEKTEGEHGEPQYVCKNCGQIFDQDYIVESAVAVPNFEKLIKEKNKYHEHVASGEPFPDGGTTVELLDISEYLD